MRMAEEAAEKERYAAEEAAEASRMATEEARKAAERKAAEESEENRRAAEAAREISIQKAEARMQASSAENLPPQLKEIEQALGNGVSLIKEEVNGVLTAVKESEKEKAMELKDEVTKAAIEQAKSAAEETIGKIEAVLGRQDSASGDVANNNGTFVQLEMENGNGGLLLQNGGLQERTPRGFKKVLKWFQCTVL